MARKYLLEQIKSKKQQQQQQLQRNSIHAHDLCVCKLSHLKKLKQQINTHAIR